MTYKNQKKLIKINQKIDSLQYRMDVLKEKQNELEENIYNQHENFTKKQEKKILKLQKNQKNKQEHFFRKKEAKQLHRQMNEPPKLTTLEEIGNAITHGCGAIFAIIAFILLLLKSNTNLKIIASFVYGISMFLMMLSSCLYHSFKSESTIKRIFRRFDYSSIYLLIGGTFAPFFLVDWGNKLGIILFILQWIVIIVGITMVCIFGPGRLKWLHFPLYFIIGWSGIMFIPGWIKNNLGLLFGILGGGIVYTFGMIPFARKNTKANHFIWHFFVLVGSIVQFLGIYLFVY